MPCEVLRELDAGRERNRDQQPLPDAETLEDQREHDAEREEEQAGKDDHTEHEKWGARHYGNPIDRLQKFEAFPALTARPQRTVA